MTRLLICMVGILVVECAAAGTPVTVGIEGRLEVWLPAADLVARAPERGAFVTVRIAAAIPHAGSTQYDLRYIGLVPGRHDLRACLQRADGSPAPGLPALEVEVRGLLPADFQGALAPAPASPLSFFGGYRRLLFGLGILWLAAAAPLFRSRRKTRALPPPLATAPPSLAERLHPLVELAAAGKLATAEKAELERMVLGHWRERLGLEAVHPAESIACLREHPEAGTLLRVLEDWLHRRPSSKPVDLEPLLASYAPVPLDPARVHQP